MLCIVWFDRLINLISGYWIWKRLRKRRFVSLIIVIIDRIIIIAWIQSSCQIWQIAIIFKWNLNSLNLNEIQIVIALRLFDYAQTSKTNVNGRGEVLARKFSRYVPLERIFDRVSRKMKQLVRLFVNWEHLYSESI